MYDIENHRNAILVFFSSSAEKRADFLRIMAAKNSKRTEVHFCSENEFDWKGFYKIRHENRHSTPALFLYDGQQFPEHPGATHLLQSNRTFNTLAVFAIEGKHRIKRMVISNADAIFVEKTDDEALQRWYYGLFGSWNFSTFEDFQTVMQSLAFTETLVLTWGSGRTTWSEESEPS